MKSIKNIQNYVVLVVLALILALSIYISRRSSGGHYAASSDFAGCYSDVHGATLRLDALGRLQSEGRFVGDFHILSPVGGKHGFLVEASSINVSDRDGRIEFSAGTGGFLWPISRTGILQITFAPAGEAELRRSGDECPNPSKTR